MAFTRTSIQDFSLANRIYAGAMVEVYLADENGEITDQLATLYEAPTGPATLENPQTLDSTGKFERPVYVQDNVIAVTGVQDGHPGTHATGLIQRNETASFIVDSWELEEGETDYPLSAAVFTPAGLRVVIDGLGQQPATAYEIVEVNGTWHLRLSEAPGPELDGAEMFAVHQAAPANVTAPAGGTVVAASISNDPAQQEAIRLTIGASDVEALGELVDVDLATPPTPGQMLAWSGTFWVPTSINLSLDDLSDVDLTTSPPSDRDLLQRVSGAWEGRGASSPLQGPLSVDGDFAVGGAFSAGIGEQIANWNTHDRSGCFRSLGGSGSTGQPDTFANMVLLQAEGQGGRRLQIAARSTAAGQAWWRTAGAGADYSPWRQLVSPFPDTGAGMTDFPAGHTILVSVSGTVNRNSQAQTLRLSTGNNFEYVNDGAGSILSGTWAARGRRGGSSDAYVFEKVD